MKVSTKELIRAFDVFSKVKTNKQLSVITLSVGGNELKLCFNDEDKNVMRKLQVTGVDDSFNEEPIAILVSDLSQISKSLKFYNAEVDLSLQNGEHNRVELLFKDEKHSFPNNTSSWLKEGKFKTKATDVDSALVIDIKDSDKFMNTLSEHLKFIALENTKSSRNLINFSDGYIISLDGYIARRTPLGALLGDNYKDNIKNMSIQGENIKCLLSFKEPVRKIEQHIEANYVIFYTDETEFQFVLVDEQIQRVNLLFSINSNTELTLNADEFKRANKYLMNADKDKKLPIKFKENEMCSGNYHVSISSEVRRDNTDVPDFFMGYNKSFMEKILSNIKTEKFCMKFVVNKDTREDVVSNVKTPIVILEEDGNYADRKEFLILPFILKSE